MATHTDLMSLFNDIGSAINDKGVNGQYYPYQMASAIRSISTGISVSGTYTVTSAGSGIDIKQYASLNVPTGGYSLFGHLDRSTATYEYGVNKYQGWYSASGRETAAATLPSTSISHITPSTSSQIAVSQYTWTLNDVVVEAIPSSYIVPSGTYTVDSAGSGIDIKQYASLNVPGFSKTQTFTMKSSLAKIEISGHYNGYATDIGEYGTIFDLSSTSVSHVVPSTSSKIIINQYRWTLNDVIIDAIPSSYIIPEGTSTITENGTYPISQYASVTVSVPTGVELNNQENVSVTPTESQQVVSAAAGYTGLGPVTVYGISSTYVGTGVPRKDSDNITITNNTGMVNVPSGYYENQTGVQLSTQAGYSITPLTTSQVAVPSYRWTTGSVIVNAIPISTILSSAINGQAYLEDTNDYGFSVTVSIPEGYYSTTTLTRSFSEILPSLNTPATSGHVLLGFEFYDEGGHLLTGSMTTNGSINTTLDSTITSAIIPAGYYAEPGVVNHTTVAIPNPTFNWNSTTRVLTASGSWTRGFTTNSTYTNTYTIPAGTVVPPTTITGTGATVTTGTNTLTFTSSIAITPTVTTAGWINSGTASTRAVILTANISTRSSTNVTTAGSTVTIPAGYYATQVTKNVTSTTHPAPSVSINSTTGVITATHTQTSGYVTAGTTSSSISLTIKAASTITPTTTSQTAVAAGTYVTGAITVAAIPSSYKLLSQTTTASASEIVAGETAYDSNGQLMTGSLEVITYYTGATAPNSSLGEDGDIYLQG